VFDILPAPASISELLSKTTSGLPTNLVSPDISGVTP
jgi:hypothetical protein